MQPMGADCRQTYYNTIQRSALAFGRLSRARDDNVGMILSSKLQVATASSTSQPDEQMEFCSYH